MNKRPFSSAPMNNEFPVKPLFVPNISSPPPLPPRRKLSSNDSFQIQDNNVLIPPPLPPRTGKVPGRLAQTDDNLLLSNLEDAEENGLNEKQLRELYDNEEIDRFLTLFSDYVTEIQVMDTPSTEKSTGTRVLPSDLHEHIPEDDEWTSISSLGEISSSPSVTSMPSTTPSSKNLSEEIAYRYVLPILPRARPSPPPFTVGRLRLAAQRIYLAILPVYGPFFSQLVSLATWEDGNTSLIYCSIYWTLWWYNFLIPALVLRVIFALLKRRVFSYPSLEDLRQHREEVIHANEFGAQVSARLSATSTGITEVFHLFKLVEEIRKKAAKQKAKDICSAGPTEESGDVPLKERDMAVSKDTVDKEEAANIKRICLYALNEIADLHERVRNMFLWRRPGSSGKYGIALFILFLITMLPAQVLSKMIYFILGFLFWHVVPIMGSLPPSDRKRLPPPFNDVPTDVEYAMQLISQRVAAGLEIKPAKPMKRDRLYQSGTSIESLPEGSDKAGHGLSQTSENPINWKKWGNRVALGKSAISDIAGLKVGSPGVQSTIETHTYPCQHRSAPGLITLTQNTMFFTPLLRQDAKIIIALTAIKGVKKVGMLKGLEVRWNDISGDKEDRFLWIGERDDLFARLMGLNGRRWLSFSEFTSMFFTPELLTRRDSGFGLLWLAATLGSKSAFKKLPKRSVLTANITQLCDLISEPVEPLALRLSSNLMFGVVRVYKVKQEILMSDVTNCVTSLKKVVQDLRASGSADGQLQMANPVARHSALTIVPNPRTAYTLDYEALVADWEEYLNIGDDTTRDNDLLLEDDDGDFDPETRRKRRSKARATVATGTETARKETHTLDEHHDHLLSASYELSFTQPGPLGAGGPSSSQAEAPFENFFPFSDGLDLGNGLGDDLARELGWDVSPIKSVRSNKNMDVDHPVIDFDEGNELGIEFNFCVEDVPMFEDLAAPFSPAIFQPDAGTRPLKQTPRKRKTPGKENAPPLLRMESGFSRAASPLTSFSAQLLSQDQEQPLPLRDITTEEQNKVNQVEPTKKVKRTRLLLDARTELTDDELKVARAKYLESQNTIRREILTKKLEKNSGRIIEELVWGVPKGIEAQVLIDFWQENFRVQVEARSGALRIHHGDEGRPLKRRKIERTELPETFEAPHDDLPYLDVDVGMGMDFGGNDPNMGRIEEAIDLRHSSEEPGQARRVSRASSILGGNNLTFNLGPRDNMNGSQRSSLFPWDNAGASSSNGNAADTGVPGNENLVDYVDVRLRSNSLSQHDSPVVPSQRGSIVIGGIGFSPVPAPPGRGSEVFGEDFAFDVDNGPEETQQETQKSDMNLITLERNSYNFLEYAKMQYQTLPKPNVQLTFETVVPNLSSTRHVAAAAFYHCLVLATKDLIHLEQRNPYEPFTIAIV